MNFKAQIITIPNRNLVHFSQKIQIDIIGKQIADNTHIQRRQAATLPDSQLNHTKKKYACQLCG